MSRRPRPAPAAGAARGPGRPRPAPVLPVGPVVIDTGTAELVPDGPGAVTLLVNGVPSSHIAFDDPVRLDFEYLDRMAAAIATLPPGPIAAVHLGAAGCGLARHVEALRPGSRQIGVDLDARLLTLVREWFDLPRSPRLRLRPGDAREVLAALPDASADVVVRDVFAGAETPAHVTTAEFLGEVRRVLRPGGLYLANCVDRPPLHVARSEVATARAVLGDVGLVAEPGQLKGRRYGNLVVIATLPGEPGPWVASATLDRALRSLAVPAALVTDADATAFAGRAPVLRDPVAPGTEPRDPQTQDPAPQEPTPAPGNDEGRP